MLVTTQNLAPSLWLRLPIALRAIVSGLLIALVAANVWPLLLLELGAPLAAIAEGTFLAFYLWGGGGGGPPATTQAVRAGGFRRGRLAAGQSVVGVLAPGV